MGPLSLHPPPHTVPLLYPSPCFSIRVFRPVLPRPVCFTPRIAPRVPSGRSSALSGTTVVRGIVSPGNFLNRKTPWVARPRTCQPSISSSRISCLPEMRTGHYRAVATGKDHIPASGGPPRGASRRNHCTPCSRKKSAVNPISSTWLRCRLTASTISFWASSSVAA